VSSFDLGGRVIVVGEVAQAHDGSLGAAHAFIDAIADAGADAVKFQTHIAAAESRPGEPWRVPFSYEDASRYDYWRRMEFTEEGWAGLARHAAERGLHFLSSPFSLEAADLLERVGVPAWKVASGEVGNHVLLRRLAATGVPVLLSSGMSPWAELDEAVRVVREAGAAGLAVLQCTSAYPTPPEQVGLNVLAELSERYGCAVGLSDHSGTVFPSLAAVPLGAKVLEVHVTLSREAFGPDVPVSLTSAELRTLVDGVRFLERALAAPVVKDAVADDLAEMRTTFTKSVVARRDLEAGATLAAEDLTLKKPGGGLGPDRLESLVGRRLAAPVAADETLTEAHLEPQPVAAPR
jgi:N-acetylneuraminate synthase